MYLVDTNVWLEELLGHVKAEEADPFLGNTPSEHFFLTDFFFHSIAVVLTRLNRVDGC